MPPQLWGRALLRRESSAVREVRKPCSTPAAAEQLRIPGLVADALLQCFQDALPLQLRDVLAQHPTRVHRGWVLVPSGVLVDPVSGGDDRGAMEHQVLGVDGSPLTGKPIREDP